MSYLDPSDTIVFRCPKCNQFISSMQQACRFCQFPITEEVIAAGAAETFNENKSYRLGLYKKVFFVGIGIFLVGFLILAQFAISIWVFGKGTFYYIGPILIAVGLGQTIMGLQGMYKEKRSRFKPN